MNTHFSRWLAAFFVIGAFALLTAACGSAATGTEPALDEAALPDEMADDMSVDDAAGDHDHGAMIDIDAAVAPTLDLEVIADAKSGLNVRVITSNFSVSPQHASTEHVVGEGHMHLLVDGDKQFRFYNDWIHIDGLSVGEHTIEVELNANTHAAYAVEGNRIAVAETVMIEESPAHDHDATATVDALDQSVSIEAFVDPKGGWNVQITPSNFVVAPERASTENVDGEGHMHLLIDGQKQRRVYGEWVYVSDQGPGEHTIEVELNANDHSTYVSDGQPVRGTVIVDGGEDSSTVADAGFGGTLVAVSVVEGVVVIDSNGSDSDRIAIPLGSEVRLLITSDVAEHIHVHGYDLFTDLAPGETTVLDFVAEIPGLVEIELEDSGTFLFELSSQ